MTKSQSCQLHH